MDSLRVDPDALTRLCVILASDDEAVEKAIAETAAHTSLSMHLTNLHTTADNRSIVRHIVNSQAAIVLVAFQHLADSLHLIRAVRDAGSAAKIVLCCFRTVLPASSQVKTQVQGIIVAPLNAADLDAALREVMAARNDTTGDDATLHRQYLRALRERTQVAAHDPLTRSESEVLHRVAIGQKAEAIAAQLHISTSTVEKHVKHICEKLGACNSASMVAQGFLLAEISPRHLQELKDGGFPQ